ncbi:MAG: hypothetical protein MMC23_009143 [Stictis urceolatum]|nr:hypothetical protein [Stictis urceolata]
MRLRTILIYALASAVIATKQDVSSDQTSYVSLHTIIEPEEPNLNERNVPDVSDDNVADDGEGENYEELDYLQGDEKLNIAARGEKTAKEPLSYDVEDPGDDNEAAAYEDLDEEDENIEARDVSELEPASEIEAAEIEVAIPREEDPSPSDPQATAENASLPIAQVESKPDKRYLEDSPGWSKDKPGCEQPPREYLFTTYYENDDCTTKNGK